MESFKLSRRKFLATTGSVTFAIAAYPLYSALDGKTAKVEVPVTAWVRLENTGRITILNPASEMGQGSMTALAVLVAEEMDADWADVVIEHSPIEPSIYGRSWGRGRGGGGTMMTVGSYTVRGYYDNLRHAGAQVRYVLRSSAAGHWNVPVEEITTGKSRITHSSGKSASYGEAVGFLQMPEKMPDIPESELKKPSEFKIIGTVIPRADIPSKSNGSAMYAMDVRLPGMQYAVMSRSPVNGRRPVLENENEIRGLAGVTDIVTLDHGVAVVAGSVFGAMEARKKMDISWSGESKAAGFDSNKAWSMYERSAEMEDGWEILEEKGQVPSGKTYSADYRNDFVYHAQMEPLNAVVSLSQDGRRAEVWAGSQAHDSARTAAASVLGISPENVILHPHYLGGGFGRRSMSDYVEEAAAIAKQVKKPVKLIWTREDDVQYGAFRPMSLQRMHAVTGNNGKIVSWEHRIIGTGNGLLASGASTEFYTFDHQQILLKNIDHGVRTKHWRAVGHGPNKFAIESFIDEIAGVEGRDPVEMRKELMREHPRALAVLNAAVEMSGWGGNLPDGRARGIGFGERSEALVAGVCEISLEANAKIRVHNIWAALDAGLVVQPDNAIAQMEGAINMGLSSILKESITFSDGAVRQSNFHDYQILRMDEAPENIEVKIIPSAEPPAGVGEAGLPWLASAVAQAFYNLTGKRIRHMPFTPERIREVLG